MNVMGFNNHAQRSTPPYYLDVDNPFKNEQLQRTLAFKECLDITLSPRIKI